MTNFYNGSATTVRGTSKHTGKLVFTESCCDFTSAKYNYKENFDDITQLSVSTVSVAVPSIFGAKQKEGIAVHYGNSIIGEFVLEENSASEVVNKVISYIHSEKDRIEQEKIRRKEAEAKQKEEDQKDKEDVLGKRGEMEKTLKELQEQLDEIPPEKQNLPQVQELREKIKRMKADLEGGYSQYEAYLKQQEEREKEKKAELEKKKAEAKGNDRGEVEEAYMYISLLMESVAGNPHEDDDSFAKSYAEDFPALDEDQIIQLRKRISLNMDDETKCQHYIDLFNKQSLSDRFNYSAGNLFNLICKGMNSLNISSDAEDALEKTSDCFASAEMTEVQKLMDEKTKKIRKQLNDQLLSVESEWTSYDTAKNYLLIELEPYDGNNYQKINEFQRLVNQSVVTVKISTKGMLSMSAPVSNIFCWYWGTSVRDIWLEAIGNKIKAAAELNDIKFNAVKTAFEDVCSKWVTGSDEKKAIIKELFTSFNGEVAEWVGSRANRAFFTALAFGATSPKDGSQNLNTPHALQAVVNDTIYVTNGENKIEAHFFGDSHVVIVTYIPCLKDGYYRLVENNIGTTEDDLDDYFDDEIEAKHIDKSYHVERDEFQASFEQLNNAIQQGQG